jgi:uncharacterized membrane protein
VFLALGFISHDGLFILSFLVLLNFVPYSFTPLTKLGRGTRLIRDRFLGKTVMVLEREAHSTRRRNPSARIQLTSALFEK